MSSACSRVFNTPELLEAVLAQLPDKDLLLAQRISRRFATAIKSSPKIQQALFFRAASSKDCKEWKINPLLRHHFLPFFALPSDSPNIETMKLMDWAHGDKRREAFLYKDASWRKMLVIQPPPRKLSVVEFCHGQAGNSANDAELSFEDLQGVTMDAIYDITIAFLQIQKVSRFGLSILDSETGPQITLYLRYTRQCCFGGDRHPEVDLRSQAASVDIYRGLNLAYRKGDKDENNPFNRRRLSMDWTTDLTPERGGVTSYEFQKWQRDRVPISSMLSDVR